jgi:hypothetical protein
VRDLPLPRPGRRTYAATIALVVAAALTGSPASAGTSTTTSTSTSTSTSNSPCGRATQATLAAVDAKVATQIYDNEISGREVRTDIANVTDAADLRVAVAADNAKATRAAVLRLIFHPAWHIVRLQVFNRSGTLLADIGGAYTIAPVPGVLKSGSRTIGSFLMSVQDDTGETKLETRFVGDPVAIYVLGLRVAQRYANFPRGVPTGSFLDLSGKRYALVSQIFNAFPSGPLVETLAIPAPTPALEGLPCSLVRTYEFGRVAQRLAALATDLPDQYPGYATTVAMYTGVDVFVHSGSRLLGTSGGSGPAKPPSSGTVKYAHASWLVYSFQPEPSVRVYLLIPPS